MNAARPVTLRALAFLALAAAACRGPAGPMVYVTNERSGDITVIDPRTDAVVRTILVGSRPRGIQMAGGRLYVALTDLGTRRPGARAAIAEIDPARGDRIRWLPSGTDPEQLAVRRDGSRLYVSNEDASAASVVDVPAGRLLTTSLVGMEPEGVTLSPDERRVFVTCESSNSVSILDAATGTVASDVLVEGRPRALAFSPDGARAYVSCELGGSVCLLDPRRDAVERCVRLAPGERPVGIRVTRDGRLVYAATGRGNTVVVLDGASGEILGRIPVGQRPWASR